MHLRFYIEEVRGKDNEAKSDIYQYLMRVGVDLNEDEVESSLIVKLLSLDNEG